MPRRSARRGYCAAGPWTCRIGIDGKTAFLPNEPILKTEEKQITARSKKRVNVPLDTGRMVVKTQLSDAYSAVNLKRRKYEVLDFIRHGLFVNPNFPRS
jgi:hypothetical protein